MSIKKYAQIGTASVLGLLLAGGTFAALQINHIRYGGELQTASKQISDLNADILPPPAFVIEPYMQVSRIAADPGFLREGRDRLTALRRDYQARYAYWRDSDLAPEVKAALINDARAPADRLWQEIESRFLPAIERGDSAAAAASYRQISRDYSEHRERIDALVQRVAAEDRRLAEEAASSMAWALVELIAVALAVLAAIGGSAWAIMRHILKPLGTTATTMEAMAAGDYSAELSGADRQDEIGSMLRAVSVFRAAGMAKQTEEAAQKLVVKEIATGLKALAAGNVGHRIAVTFAPQYEQLRSDYNAAAEELGSVLSQVAESAQSVHTGSSEISAASDDLARRTEQQAASLEETAAAMNQVTGMVRETAQSAKTVSDSVNDAHRDANDGGAVVREAVSAMDGIERSAQEIAQITNVIDGIAFQTNLLALNAGVEAARAGDAGKGFAVVANEVRALAQRSADAAKDIKALIGSSTEQVETGVQLVGRTGEMLERIVAKVGEVSRLVTEIASSAEAQANNLRQINGAVSDMDKMTQQNAAMVEESTAAARSLATEADQLSALIARFGSNEAAAPAPSRRAPARSRPRAVVKGNLALKADAADDDWAEF
jgi:methyl-accepting chemotaxis protein